MDLSKALSIAARGLDAQGARVRVIAGRLADQDTTGPRPEAAAAADGEASGRKTAAIENMPGRDVGEAPRGMRGIRQEAASYNANLAVLETVRGLLVRTISMLR